MHADFGGTGLLADYQAESTDTARFTTVGTATAGSFPTAKVVGGIDFAGDAYTGTNAPVPDANPMDCNGHGSHVAGTAAGFGVTAADATFTGPYDANPSTYSRCSIGPGTAPKALLYGLRVFGCAASTGLTALAIDWAIDPNGDADLSDHLDVINMSLGSNFGSVVNATRGRLRQRGAGRHDRGHLGGQRQRHLLHLRRSRLRLARSSPRRPRSTTAWPRSPCWSTRRARSPAATSAAAPRSAPSADADRRPTWWSADRCSTTTAPAPADTDR